MGSQVSPVALSGFMVLVIKLKNIKIDTDLADLGLTCSSEGELNLICLRREHHENLFLWHRDDVCTEWTITTNVNS